MATITKTKTKAGEPRYKVQYRDPAGRQRYRTFRREKAARSFRLQIEHEIERGEWVDPHAGRQTFAEVAEAWLEVADVKATTRSGYRSVLDRHLLPRFGSMPIAAITTPEVERFLADKRAEPAYNRTGKATSPETVRNIRNNLSAVMRYAERSGMIRSNPVVAVRAPKSTATRPEMRILTAGEVNSLAEHADPRYRLAVMLDAYTGLRAGELWGLKAGRIDLMRKRIIVADTVTEVHGKQVIGPPKNHQTRTVPIPAFLVDDLAKHLARSADNDDAYLFTAPRGGPVRHSTFYDRHFQPAAVAAGLAEWVDVEREVRHGEAPGVVRQYRGPRFHDLRHTAVSFMIAAGASPLVISRVIGHGSISVTYDVYGHILPDHADDLARGLDAIYSSAETPTGATVAELHARG